MTKFVVSTGSKWKHTIEAVDPKDAVITALKKWPPKSAGLLIEIIGPDKEPRYMDTIHCLNLAGFSVEEAK